MARQTVVYNDFSGGEYGDKGAWKAPRNSFTAINMLVNRQGELMVRPGLRNATPAGTPVGIVRGFGDTGIPTQDAWFAIGNTIRTFDILAGNNLETATGTLSGTPTSPISSFVSTNQIYLTARGLTTSYVLNNVPATPTLTALTGAPAGTTITVYGDRWLIGDVESSLDNRIRYSDAANPNSWPSANFIDVGDGWGIRALWPQRQHLTIMKQTGAYVLTGVPGVNEVLRFIGKAQSGPLSPNDVVCSRDDKVWWWPGSGTGLNGPHVFAGSQPRALNYLNNHIASASDGESFPPGTGVQGAAEDYADGIFFCSDENKGILLQNGIFTYHTFGVNTSGFLGRGQNGRVYICDGGGAAVAPKFYVWNYWADTPGIEGGDQMRAGDDSASPVSGSVTFPEYWDQSADEVRVRSVIVDFRKWNTGGSANNHFDLAVDTLRRYGGGGAQASNTVSFDESPGSAGSGTLDRKIFGFGEQGIGNGFQLNFTNCKGIAIQRVEVILDVNPVRI